MVKRMSLKKILHELEKLNITGISDDTRYLQEGELFVSRKGNKDSGENYLEEAVKLGAKVILSEEKHRLPVPVVVAKDIEKIFPELLFRFYDYPQYELRLIGVTGTDGKTTTASIIEHLLNQNYNACYIGTNGIRHSDYFEKTKYTTLPLCLLVKRLRLLADMNIRHVVMEVSSQGLINKRLEGIEFEVAIFTNLTHEHLDTHKSMENYLQAKQLLFSKLEKNGLGIVNIDSPYGKYFQSKKLLTYGIKENADFQAYNIRESSKFTSFDLKTPEEIWEDVRINLFGTYNVYNALAAIATALHFKIPKATIYKALQTIPKIEGRMEIVTTSEPFTVYVDFAHTPNALQEVLSWLKTRHPRILLVLGSAGGKDKSKRPLLGKVATTLADVVFFTSEDPRFEKAEDIISDLIEDVKNENYEIIIDRKEAILAAIMSAKEGDAVLIAGKGNDDYFEENGKIQSYSDIEVAEWALSERKKHSNK